MADLPNVCTVGVQCAGDALRELRRWRDRRPKREKPSIATEADEPEEVESVGDCLEREKDQLDVKV